jgi:hypothetical protein
VPILVRDNLTREYELNGHALFVLGIWFVSLLRHEMSRENALVMEFFGHC